MPTLTTEVVPAPTVRKSSRIGNENHQQPNNDAEDSDSEFQLSVDNENEEEVELELSESEDEATAVPIKKPSAKKKTTSGNTRGKGKNQQRKRNDKGEKKKKSSANMSKVVVGEEVEVEGDDRLAALTTELKNLKERFNTLAEDKNAVVDENREREHDITLLTAELTTASSEATYWKKSSDTASKRETDIKKDLDKLKVEHAKEKKEIAASHKSEKEAIIVAHKKEVEGLEAMHALDKANIEFELETKKSALLKAEKELSDVKKALDKSTKDQLHFLQEKAVNQHKFDHNLAAQQNRARLREEEKERATTKSRQAGMDKFSLVYASQQGGFNNYHPPYQNNNRSAYDPRMIRDLYPEDHGGHYDYHSNHHRSGSGSCDRSSRSRRGRSHSRSRSRSRRGRSRSRSHSRSHSRSRSRSPRSRRDSSSTRSSSSSRSDNRSGSRSGSRSSTDNGQARRISDTSYSSLRSPSNE